MTELSLLYQDTDCVVIDKPSGFHVHPPEFAPRSIPREKIILYLLREQLQKWVFPIHRLDAATSGCLLFALNETAASELGQLSESRKIRKTYQALLRGWTEDEFTWEQPLQSQKNSKIMQEAVTQGRTLKRFDMPAYSGSKHPRSRYSLVELEIHTGRFHQIRRHANHNAHPVVGDVSHGDRHHNHFFRDVLKLEGLCLRATELRFQQPLTQVEVHASAPLSPLWRLLEENLTPAVI